MEFSFLTTQMARQAQMIKSLVQGVSQEQAVWKPSPDEWSILEVINHLYDEEIEDFRAHVNVVLHHPDRPWPRIDPQGWVTARAYNQRKIGPSLKDFLNARQASLDWLKGLASPDWEAVHEAPWGAIKAGDVCAAWVAHDLLHMRQLVELHFAYVTRAVRPYGVDYAGQW
jgi:hypothetical protein